MTRKDYVKFAAAIARLHEEMHDADACCSADSIERVRAFAGEMAAILAADNPNFDALKFYKACGIEREES